MLDFLPKKKIEIRLSFETDSSSILFFKKLFSSLLLALVIVFISDLVCANNCDTERSPMITGRNFLIIS